MRLSLLGLYCFGSSQSGKQVPMTSLVAHRVRSLRKRIAVQNKDKGCVLLSCGFYASLKVLSSESLIKGSS